MTTEGDGTTPPVPTAPAVKPDDLRALTAALTEARDTIRATRYALSLPTAAQAAETSRVLAAQLDDYLLPRLRRLDAPLLAVVGGSTGAGKSTLVNSLVRVPVSPAGVLRPTTRAPVLVSNPEDGPWFAESDLLPGLTRVTGATHDADTLQVVAAPALTPGVALLDAPDIDSVVDANRALASQLLAAADLWLFVTTAARYADAVPWDLLQVARSRGTAVALVLDRVPPGAGPEIAPHLEQMLTEHGLTGVPLFVLPESALDGQGLLGEEVTAPLRDWLDRLARSAETRTAVVRRTVGGSIDAMESAVTALSGAADEQVSAAWALASAVRTAYRAAESTVDRGIADGALLRGEVLARWQELVGTGDVMRALQSRIARLRDRIIATFTGRIGPTERYAEALESGIVALLRSAAVEAAEQAGAAWRAHPAGNALLAETATNLATPGADLDERVQRLVRDWQRGVLDLVRTEAGDKRAVARAGAYAVNAAGLLVMTLVFTATSFIPTGAEVAVAGGTTVAAQKVLEAIFGDQAVRTLATRAREDLLTRVRALLSEESTRYQDVLDGAEVDEGAGERLRRAANTIMIARLRAGLPAARTEPVALPATESIPAQVGPGAVADPPDLKPEDEPWPEDEPSSAVGEPPAERAAAMPEDRGEDRGEDEVAEPGHDETGSEDGTESEGAAAR